MTADFSSSGIGGEGTAPKYPPSPAQAGPRQGEPEILRAAARILRRGWGKKAERITPRLVLRVLADAADAIEDAQESKP